MRSLEKFLTTNVFGLQKLHQTRKHNMTIHNSINIMNKSTIWYQKIFKGRKNIQAHIRSTHSLTDYHTLRTHNHTDRLGTYYDIIDITLVSLSPTWGGFRLREVRVRGGILYIERVIARSSMHCRAPKRADFGRGPRFSPQNLMVPSFKKLKK